MINFKKGISYSLLQSDFIGTLPSSLQGVVAGNVVRLDPTTGNILLGSSTSGPVTTVDLLGFAINNDTDGDVTESGKLGAIALDGNSVIETDQVATAITTTNYPVGTKLTTNTSGTVQAAGSTDRIIGTVEGIRNLPKLTTVNSSQGVPTQVQSFVPVLAIKLNV